MAWMLTQGVIGPLGGGHRSVGRRLPRRSCVAKAKAHVASHRVCRSLVRNFHPLSNVLKPELRGASHVEHRKGAELNITFVVKALNRPEKADRGILPAVGMKA